MIGTAKCLVLPRIDFIFLTITQFGNLFHSYQSIIRFSKYLYSSPNFQQKPIPSLLSCITLPKQSTIFPCIQEPESLAITMAKEVGRKNIY